MKIELFQKTKYCPYRSRCNCDISQCLKCKKYLQFEKHIYDVYSNSLPLPLFRIIVEVDIAKRVGNIRLLRIAKEPDKNTLEDVLKVLKVEYVKSGITLRH